MNTLSKSGTHVQTMLAVVNPVDVVGEILGLCEAGTSLGIALDLQKLDMNAIEAAQWIRDFTKLFNKKAREFKYAQRAPSVAVFGDSFSNSEKIRLRHVGAIVFDRSSPSNADCQTSDALLEKVDRILESKQANNCLAHQVPSVQLPIAREALKSINSYPPGATKETLDELIRHINGTSESQNQR